MELNYDKYCDKGLTGLANVGNSCYINSCMQLLSHTYELNELLDNLNKKNINNNIEAVILNEWNNLRQLMWSENCTIAPWGFIKAIHRVASEKKNALFIFCSHSSTDISPVRLIITSGLSSKIILDNFSLFGNSKQISELEFLPCFKIILLELDKNLLKTLPRKPYDPNIKIFIILFRYISYSMNYIKFQLFSNLLGCQYLLLANLELSFLNHLYAFFYD